MVVALRVADVANRGVACATIEVDESTSLAELRALILSLPTESAQKALKDGGESALRICHDGKFLHGDESVTLSSLGVLDPPVVVIASSPPIRNASSFLLRRKPAAAAAMPTPMPQQQPQQQQQQRQRQPLTPPPDQQPQQPPASAQPTTAQEPEADAVCRICFGSAYENGAGALFSPCLCTGSMRFVHASCLNEWRLHSANPRSFFQCDQCSYQYNVERTRWAQILESDRVVQTFAAVLLVCAVGVAALLLAPLGFATRFFTLVAFNPRSAYQVGDLVASVWCWQLDALCSGVIGVALVGVGYAIRDAYNAHRHMTHTWAAGVVTALMTNDERIFRVFALFGAVVSARTALETAKQIAKQLLTKWGHAVQNVTR